MLVLLAVIVKFCVPAVFRKAAGWVTPVMFLCTKFVFFHVFLLFCAEASGDRNETPAARTSRKRKTRVGKRETPVRAAESKQGGGVSYRRSASRRLFQRSRGLRGRAAPAPGNPLPPKVSLQVPLHPPYHQYDEANYNHKSGAMSTRPPPPEYPGTDVSVLPELGKNDPFTTTACPKNR